MTFHNLDPGLRHLVGPEADHQALGDALRADQPRAYGFKATSPAHLCLIAADAHDFCSEASPAGGLALCELCATPIFVGPATCIYRLAEPDDLEITVDVATGRIVG